MFVASQGSVNEDPSVWGLGPWLLRMSENDYEPGAGIVASAKARGPALADIPRTAT